MYGDSDDKSGIIIPLNLNFIESYIFLEDCQHQQHFFALTMYYIVVIIDPLRMGFIETNLSFGCNILTGLSELL